MNWQRKLERYDRHWNKLFAVQTPNRQWFYLWNATWLAFSERPWLETVFAVFFKEKFCWNFVGRRHFFDFYLFSIHFLTKQIRFEWENLKSIHFLCPYAHCSRKTFLFICSLNIWNFKTVDAANIKSANKNGCVLWPHIVWRFDLTATHCWNIHSK